MVYVDDMEATFGKMIMCHMIADTTAELLAMADKIGVQRKWIQYPGTHHEHFDICLSKKAKALKMGATGITWRELGRMTMRREEGLPLTDETDPKGAAPVSFPTDPAIKLWDQ